MDNYFKSLLETLNLVLKKLQLENNIFGYIVVFLILATSALVAIFTFACLVRKLKSCNEKSNFAEFGTEI